MGDVVDRFFHVTLPAVSEDARAYPALAASMCIVVGERAFTVRMHDERAPVVDGADAGAPVQLWLSDAAFRALVDGNASRIGAHEVGLRGDPLVLEQLGRLLAGDVRPFARAAPQGPPLSRAKPGASAALQRARQRGELPK